MTVKEIMERGGTTATGRAIAYIKDGLDEIARAIEDNIQSTTVDIVSGTREYGLPESMVKLYKISIKNSDGDYQGIPRLTHGPNVEK
tara:strand:- start:34 stop:294 length:261 start_codon:yes stop_codon:yes gene_type:complete